MRPARHGECEFWGSDQDRSPAAATGRRPAAAGFVALTLLTGCSFAPEPETPATIVAMPTDFRVDADLAGHEATGWWGVFDDPTLDRLIETALEANLDLRESVARLDELRHRYRIARAPLMPSVTLNGDANRSDSPGNTGFGGSLGGEETDGATPPDSTGGFGFTFPDRFAFTTYTASVGFAYELDFWGRLRNESGAAARDFLASRADAETVRLTVIASTISTYLELVATRLQLANVEENVDLLRERTELTDERYRAGLTTSFELYTIRQLFRTAQVDLTILRTLVADIEGRLALILGRYAGNMGELLPQDLDPAVDTSPVPAGLPVTLLEERPDVLAAHARLEAARLRVGARRAELLPTISLNGSVGFQSSEPSNLFRADQWFLSLIGGIVAPIFHGGRLRANVGVADAQYDQVMVAYVRTVLNAFREVRTSLVQLDNERERYVNVLEQVADANASLAYQLRRFQIGIGDYVSYLDARLSLNSAETTLAQAERGLGEARLAVHRALGGAWTEEDLETQEPRQTNDAGSGS